MQSEGLSESARAFVAEADVTMEGVDIGILEKNLSSQVRVQKKILGLEKQIKQLTEASTS